jgi:DNA-directed RNA polymerase specialized sigma24 family protein
MTSKSLFGARALTDAEIVAGIGGTERERNKAIEALYEQNRAFLTRFLRGKQNSQYLVKEPDDIIWETIMAVLNNILDGRYVPSPSTPLSGYVVSICRNIWFKTVSQEANRDTREADFWAEWTQDVPADAEQWLHNQQQWSRYLDLFDRAGKHCRQILTLWLVDDLDNKAITEIMVREGKLKSEQVIRNTKSDCLKKLTDLLR